MWAEACALLDQAERRHRRFFELLSVPTDAPVWEPPVNIFSVGPDLLVEVALPGARADGIVIQLMTSGLVIETTVAPPRFTAATNVVRLEIPYGRMRRRIDLPPGRYALLEHRLEHGCLFLHLSGTSK